MNKRIPTIFGLLLLVVGLVSGVFLTQNPNLPWLNASTISVPQNVHISNITHNSFTVSWSTNEPTTSIIKFGSEPHKLNNMVVSSQEQRYTHHVEVDGLESSSEYYYQINSISKLNSFVQDVNKVKTGREIAPKHITELASGKIITQSGLEVSEAIVYVDIPGGNLLSDTTTTKGEWVIAISNMRSKDLSNYLRIKNDDEVKIFVNAGPLGFVQATTKAANVNPVPPIILGRDYDYMNNTSIFDDEKPSGTLNID